MNIVKLQEQLKSVPDDVLVGYVQNPGQVPSYLALSELQRRKAMRAQYQAQAAGGQAEQPSIAEQLTAPEQPMQGIAALPVDNVGNEEAYKVGGIVGFTKGGDAGLEALNAHLISIGRRPLTKEEYYAGPPSSRNIDGSSQYIGLPETPKPPYGRGNMGKQPVLSLPTESLKEEPEYVGRGAKKINYGFSDIERFGRGAMGQTPDSKPAAVPGVVEMPNWAADLAESNAAQIRRDIASGKYNKKEVPPTREGSGSSSARASVSTSGKTGAGQGIAGNVDGFPEWKDYIPDPLNVDEYKKRMGEKPTVEGIAGLMEAKRKERGISEDPYASYMEEAKADKEAARKDYESNLWMRLAEFGTTWASTAGPTLAAAGEAGKKVVPNLIADKREMRKAERELSKDIRDMAIARENMREARLKGDMERYDQEMNRYTKAEDSYLEAAQEQIKQGNAAKLANISGKRTLELEKAKFGQKEREMQLDASLKREQIKATRDVGNRDDLRSRAELIRKEHNDKNPNNPMTFEEALTRASKSSFAAQIESTAQRANAATVTAYSKWAQGEGRGKARELEKQGLDSFQWYITEGPGRSLVGAELTYNPKTRKME